MRRLCQRITHHAAPVGVVAPNAASHYFRSASRCHGDAAEAAAKATGLWGAYLRFCVANPVTGAVGTSAVLWGIGDAAAQRMEAGGSETAAGSGHQHGTTQRAEENAAGQSTPAHHANASFDKARWFGTVVEGSGVGGGLGLFWYAFLDTFVSKYATSGSLKFVGMKLGLEFLVWHPFTLFTFWTFVGLVQGSSWSQIKRELQTDYSAALASEYVLWAPIDILNFWLVPVHLQVLCINCGSLLEAVVISHIHSHGFPDIFGAGSKHDDAAAALAPPVIPGDEEMRRRPDGSLTVESRQSQSLPFKGTQRDALPGPIHRAIGQALRKPASLKMAEQDWSALDTDQRGVLTLEQLQSQVAGNRLPGVSDKLVARFLGTALLERARRRGQSGAPALLSSPSSAGFITKAEYMALLRKLHEVDFEYENFDHVVFSLFDTNGDGVIDRHEAASFVDVVVGCQRLVGSAAESRGDGPRSGSSPTETHGTTTVTQLFDKYDLNKDNQLSFAEVRRVLRDLRKAEG